MPTVDYKTALITGGSHRIGGHISEKLAAEGWAVAINYHDSSTQADELAQTIVKNGGRAVALAADLYDPDACINLVTAATKRLGPLGALVNNASIFEPDLWDSVTPKSWDAHLAVNLRAPFFLSQAFARAMPETSTGAIVNIIDQRVWNLKPDFMSYTVSKSGLLTLTKTLALALAPRIRVNAVGPGPTLPSKRQDEASFKAQNIATPLGHGAEPSDIADGVLYLLGARAVTGQMIAIDGGEHVGKSPSLLEYGIDG